MTFNYSKARKIFALFKTKILKNSEIQNEIRKALEKLLSEYDTSIRENRFIVGGVVEHLLVATFKSLDFKAQRIGDEEKRIDLVIDEVGFSVKTSFTGKGDIRLINKLGASSVGRADNLYSFKFRHCLC